MSLGTQGRRLPAERVWFPRGREAIGSAFGLTWLLVGLVTCAGLTGLLVEGVYAGAASTTAMLRGYDLVTVVVVVPALVGSTILAGRGSVVAHLVTAGLLGYLVYTYAYYLFGTGFNDLFLLHVAIFSTALVALGSTLASLDLTALVSRFGRRTKVHTVAGIVGVLAAALGGMWIYLAIDNAVTEDIPAGSRLVETPIIVHLGMALDLALLVPLYAAAAVLLWRRQPWGYALAGVAVFAGLLHQVSYLVALPFQVAADVPGAVAYDLGEPVIVLLYLTATVLLLRGVPRREEASEP